MTPSGGTGTAAATSGADRTVMAPGAPRRPSARRAPRRAPQPPRPEAPATAAQERLSAVALAMGTLHLRHVLRLYAAFDRDLLEAVVLGEVAEHNFSAIRAAARSCGEPGAVARRHDDPRSPAPLPTNAYSIAEATGIPRETVRRKIAALVGKRLLRRDEKGGLFVTALACERIETFNAESVAALLGTCRQIEAMLRGPQQGC